MQWLTDIVFEMIAATLTGIIVAWYGSIASIPDGWALCDGTQGTPDLRDKEIVGAGTTYSPDDEGGNAQHPHPFTANGHFHSLPAGAVIAAGVPRGKFSTVAAIAGTTDNGSTRGPFRAHCFIKRL